jgi:hypothetical protein
VSLARVAWELAAVFSGHSLRRGYGTTAAEKGVRPHCIQGRMRHKDFGTASGCIAAGKAWSQSGLKGIFVDGEKVGGLTMSGKSVSALRHSSKRLRQPTR